MAEGLKAMALEGHGLAFLPASSVSKELKARRLVRAAPPGQHELTMEVRIYRERPEVARHVKAGRGRRCGQFLQCDAGGLCRACAPAHAGVQCACRRTGTNPALRASTRVPVSRLPRIPFLHFTVQLSLARGVRMKKSLLAASAACLGVRSRGRRAGAGHAEEDQGQRRDHDGRARIVRRAGLHARRRQVRRLPRRGVPAVIADIQKQLGMAKLDIKYQPVTSQNRIPLVQNGTVDIECGSTTNNAARQKDVAFAPTTYVEEVRIAVKANSGITAIAQLNGKKVATTTGTTSVQLLRKHERAPRRRLQGGVRQGPRRQLPAARIGPRRRVRDGRPDPRRPDLQVEEPGRLQDRRRSAVGRADRDHVPQGRPGLQEGGRRQRQGA